ncbi:MAG: PDZ domain-containing protein [Gammaproteobacteria bacterium]|nr:PDZ domain-containing protein [Gammaproteobacteria bacterium]
MSSWKILASLAAAFMVAAQAHAQSDTQGQDGTRQAVQQTAPMRDAEVDRRLYEAEKQMAEAARQMAELTAERLPHRANLQRRLEIIGDGGPRLGVTIGGDDKNPVTGVVILGVTPGSAADDAGLRAGDLITAVNGEAMAGDSSDAAAQKLIDFMGGVVEGDKLDIEYLRDGKSGKVEVEPRAIDAQVFAFGFDGRNFGLPGVPRAMIAPGGPGNVFFEWHSDSGWGDMELVELNAGLGRYFGTEQGLLVVNAPKSKALQLEDGDVIQKIDGREPTSVRHALRILGSYQSGETLKLEIMRDKKRRTLDVEVPEDLSSGLMPEIAPAMRPAYAPAPAPARKNPRVSTPVEKT